MKDLTIKDIKNYIKELEIEKDAVIDMDKDNKEVIVWFEKQIAYFTKKLKELEEE